MLPFEQAHISIVFDVLDASLPVLAGGCGRSLLGQCQLDGAAAGASQTHVPLQPPVCRSFLLA